MKEKPDPTRSTQAAAFFTWNLVKGAFEPSREASAELRSRIDRLAFQLERFPPEHVHLLVSLDKLDGNRVETKLDLKLPATVLHARDKGEDLFETVRHSFFVLEQQVNALIEKSRGEHRWRRRSSQGRGTPSFGEPAEQGPQSRDDLLRTFISRHYNRLLLHATRRLTGLEAESDIPPGQIDALEVLDEVTRICLASPERKPPELTYELWLYQLIREELDREYQDWMATYRKRADFPEEETEENAEELSMQDATVRTLEPDEMLNEEHLADPSGFQPDFLLEGEDLIADVMRRVRYWKRRDREIFTLHFLDGFDATETAMVEKMEVAEVESVIQKLHQRLRHILRDAAR